MTGEAEKRRVSTQQSELDIRGCVSLYEISQQLTERNKLAVQDPRSQPAAPVPRHQLLCDVVSSSTSPAGWAPPNLCSSGFQL